MLYLLKNDRRIIAFLNIRCIFQITKLIKFDLVGTIHFDAGETSKVVAQINEKATIYNTLVLATAVGVGTKPESFAGYYINSGQLIIKTTSTIADQVSYAVKYLF